MRKKAPFPVRKYHIDTNEHVNNCQYVQMALEVLPRDILVSQVRVDYKKSAVLGDKIFPETAQKKDRVIVRLCDEDRKPYAVMNLKPDVGLKDRVRQEYLQELLLQSR